eukprot:6195-Heterococcus_DN1.PRE.2
MHASARSAADYSTANCACSVAMSSLLSAWSGYTSTALLHCAKASWKSPVLYASSAVQHSMIELTDVATCRFRCKDVT